MRLARQLLILIAAVLGITGGCTCREPTYPVSGKVVYKDDGSPAAAGVAVVFESTKEPYTRAMGVIQPDGSFILSTDRPDNGAMQGEHRVCILPLATDGSGMNLTQQLSQKIDPKYFELGTSGLKFEIQPSGKNEFAIEVDRPGGAKASP
jgi:hypothetical protein